MKLFKRKGKNTKKEFEGYHFVFQEIDSLRYIEINMPKNGTEKYGELSFESTYILVIENQTYHCKLISME